ncbi:DUF898 family protein [Rhodocista pekingensis]|uniref:DUF898 family protein n=1 Tax=Rhodocista pekingensis TaxID=201185 RepID=A0ABW2KXZ0_9PROT
MTDAVLTGMTPPYGRPGTETGDATGGGTGDGAVRFEAGRGALIGLLLTNMLLNLLTLGLYRFWARTRVRRFFWGALRIDGRPLDYTGRGMELFLGFLVALVLLAPVLAVFQFVANVLTLTHPVAGVTVTLLFYPLLGALALTGAYFARRYLLTRTRWSGIAAGQDGTAVRFVGLHLWAYLLATLSLGIAMPWADAKTYRYRMSITRFGTGRFGSDADSRGLWGAWLAAWGLLALGTVLWAVGFTPALETMEEQQAGVPPTPLDLNDGLLAVAVLLYAAGLLALAFYRLVRFRHFTRHTWLEGIRFRCDAPVRAFIGVIAVTALLLLGVAGLAALAGIGIAMLIPTPMGVVVGGAVALLLLLAATPLVTTGYYLPALLTRLAAHGRITGLSAADAIVNRAAPAPRRGEGLIDAVGDIGIGL